jgi:hypothetical protein
MADRRRNGLVTIAGQLESWVICEFAGSTINNVRWSKLAPEWAEQVGRDVLGLPLDAASQLEQKVFSQVIDDIDHVANTVCGDPVSVQELVDQVTQGFSYPDEKWDFSAWMHSSSYASGCMNEALGGEVRIYNMKELLAMAVTIRVDQIIYDAAVGVARLVEQWELDHATEDD